PGRSKTKPPNHRRLQMQNALTSVTALNYGFGPCDCGKHCGEGQKKLAGPKKIGRKEQKNLDHFSIYACHPCAGAMLIFSVSFQFYRMSPKGQAKHLSACI
ncbi:unnamed protein product, partial [Prunus brigantina]